MKFFDELDWLLPLETEFLKRIISKELDGDVAIKMANCRFNDRQAAKLRKVIDSQLSVPGCKNVRLAILTDCNLDFCSDMLIVNGLRYGMKIELLLVEYSDIIAQIMNPQSDFYLFKPNFVLFAAFGALPSSIVATFSHNNDTSGLASQAINQIWSDIQTTVEMVLENCDAQMLVQSLPETQPDLFGNRDRYQSQAMGYEILMLNKRIENLNVPIVDIAKLANRIGTYRWVDDGKYHWTKVPFDLRWSAHYCDNVMRSISLATGRGKKVLVLDLDNTLWGGVIGDDGVDGIELGNNSAVGEAFLAGQRYYKMLANRGVALAVCSKNDMDNAQLPFHSHPEMILSLEDITCFVANWDDKPSNINYIAESLGLGLDSFVFLDDNPMERDIVRQQLPQVAVPQVPDNNPSLYPRYLEAAGYFESTGFTVEDLLRVKDYKANAERTTAKKIASNIDDYLAGLDMKFHFGQFNHMDEERIVQLINRSNQFNLTTIRYTNVQVKALYGAKKKFGFSARLSDKFSDSGLVALLIIEVKNFDEKFAWEVDTWVMSCRVLGRRVEEVTLSRLAVAARASGVQYLIGRYIPTPKNEIVREHYQRLGFSNASDRFEVKNEGETVWLLDIEEYLQIEAETKPLPFEYL